MATFVSIENFLDGPTCKHTFLVVAKLISFVQFAITITIDIDINVHIDIDIDIAPRVGMPMCSSQ
jgi:hypothetical protein